MTQTSSRRLRPVVDVRAALIAGLVSGIIFILIGSLVTTNALGTPISLVRLFSSIVLGASIMNPATPVTPIAYVGAIGIHLLLSVGFGLLVAFVVHRWGIVVGIVGGAVLGLALYVINFYALSLLFPWFFTFRSLLLLGLHVVYGAVTGGIYELIEKEKYEEVL